MYFMYKCTCLPRGLDINIFRHEAEYETIEFSKAHEHPSLSLVGGKKITDLVSHRSWVQIPARVGCFF